MIIKKILISIFLLFSINLNLIGEDKFVILTPPKSGTHLLTKTVSLIVGKQYLHYGQRVKSHNHMLNLMNKAKSENRYFENHHVTPKIINMLKENDYKIISLMRDPRDQLISILNWSLEGNWPHIPLHKLSPEEQINELISGEKFGWKAWEESYETIFRISLLKTLSPSFLYTAHFEKLVGPQGGGTLERQIIEILNIADHINVPMTLEEAEEIAKKSYGNTWTFRNGKLDNWKIHFTSGNKKNYKNVYGELLISLEYEKSLNW